MSGNQAVRDRQTRQRVRAVRVIAAAGLLVLAGCSSMLLGGSGASAGRPIGQDSRTGDQVAADDRISATIRARYRADAELASAGLSVDTVRGVVTLRGTVPVFEQRDRAVRLAGDVAGVIRVDNQISVRSR